MKRFAAALPLLAVLTLAPGATVQWAQADAPTGTFVAQGQKGPITLKLVPDQEGGISGTLSGGSLDAKLEGDAENDVIMGIVIDGQGQMMSGFRVSHAGGSVVLELGELSEDDKLTVKNRLVFGTGGAAPEPKRGPLAGGSWPQAATKPSGGTPRFAVKPAARPAAKPVHKAAAKPRVAARHKGRGGTAVASGGPAANSNWKVFKHAIGVSMRYPATWTQHPAAGMLQLIPPDVLMANGQAREIYVAFADGSSGVTTAEDPRVVQLLDQKMQGFAPFLQRTGEPQSVKAGTLPGIKVTWEGTNPTGLQVLAHMYVVILKGYGVGVLALGDSKRIAMREGTVQQMFSSLAGSSEKRDARLAGRWKFWSYKGNSQYSVETNRSMVLDPSGRCSWNSNGEAVGSFNTGNLYNNSGSGSLGRWSADNGVLYILWDDGDNSSWGYRFEPTQSGGRRLYLTGSNGKTDEWNPQ